MKTIKLSVNIFLTCFLVAAVASAQQQSETAAFKVNGNCGMCKNTIEKAAKNAGVTFADWNKETHVMTVRYAVAGLDALKIQQAIANAGYDTEKVKADDAAYSKLPACCQYDRTASVTSKDEMQCCANGDRQACLQGKCEKDANGICIDKTTGLPMDKVCKEKGCCKKS